MSIKYYAIYVEENEELNVENRIRKLDPVVELLIPVEEDYITLDGRKFLTMTRLMPDYVLAGFEEMSTEEMNKINKIRGVIQVLADKIQNVLRPAAIEKNEANRFLKKKYDPSINNLFKKNSSVNILNGQFAGFSAKIIDIHNDEVSLSVNIKHDPRLSLPVWQIGIPVEDK